MRSLAWLLLLPLAVGCVGVDQAPRGGRMTVEVSLAASGHFLASTYRLYVVGAGAKFSQTDIRGDHQRPL